MKKTTLSLNLPTDPRWVDVAGKSLADILVDHAYCEQKAASSCISLIVQYPEKTRLVEILTPVVTEEWEHFGRVLDQLRKRGLGLGRQRKDEYVQELNRHMRKGGSRDEQLMEKLLVNALIEARSCERFKVLANNLEDQELCDFYSELVVSEATHYRNFLKLAKEYVDPVRVDARWKELLKTEAGIIGGMSLRGDRIH